MKVYIDYMKMTVISVNIIRWEICWIGDIRNI